MPKRKFRWNETVTHEVYHHGKAEAVEKTVFQDKLTVQKIAKNGARATHLGDAFKAIANVLAELMEIEEERANGKVS